MDAVWECLPDEFRLADDSSWLSSEARKRLAVYNHPTILSLILPLADGGFGDAEDPRSYQMLVAMAGLSRIQIRASARLSRTGAGHRRELLIPV